MSQENVELAYRAYENLQRDDIEGFLSYVHPEAEWHSLVLQMEGTFHGHDGVREWWSNLRSAFPDWRPFLEEGRDLGADWVLLHARAQARGAGSGVGIDGDFWQIGRIRRGQITHYAAFRTQQEALEAVRRSNRST
jgi:hypothetical protein